MSDQLQPEDTLDDRGVDDILDEGISPPERLRGSEAKSTTTRGQIEGETIDERLAQEEPETDPAMDPRADHSVDPTEPDLDNPDENEPGGPGGSDPEVGDERSGRLVAPDEGLAEDTEKDLVARDVGIDGAAAPAEEAAVHEIDPDER